MKAIVAVAKHGIIGDGTKMGWHVKDDLKHFKEVTHKSVVVMGRKTYESIGMSLPNRINVILTRDTEYIPYNDADIVVNSVEDVLKLEADYLEKGYDTFCIGGGEVYNLFDYEEIYMTRINKEVEGTVKFELAFTNKFNKVTSVRPKHYDANGEILARYYKFSKQNLPK